MSGTRRLPRARSRQHLIIEEVGSDLLVYDESSNRAHCLNRTAALIWRHCELGSTVESLLQALASEGVPADPQVVELALAQLSAANLVEARPSRSFQTRRTLLKHLGVIAAASIALPVVESIVAPAVAEAASGQIGSNCSKNGDCTSGCCVVAHCVAPQACGLP